MSKVFRARFVAGLRREFPEQDRTFFTSLFKKEWVVYAKRPFQHPKAVVEYLGRYTHKIAISNHRLLNLNNGQVTFSYKDYRKGAQKMQMSLTDKEFIRRFSQHILPRGFVRIRHYGFLSSSWKSEKLPCLQQMLGLLPSSDDQVVVVSHRRCCACSAGTLQTMSMFYGRAPPKIWLERIANQHRNQ